MEQQCIKHLKHVTLVTTSSEGNQRRDRNPQMPSEDLHTYLQTHTGVELFNVFFSSVSQGGVSPATRTTVWTWTVLR